MVNATAPGRVLPDAPVMLRLLCGGAVRKGRGSGANWPSGVSLGTVVMTKLTVPEDAVAVTVEGKNDSPVCTLVARKTRLAWPLASVVVLTCSRVPDPCVIFQATATPGAGCPEALFA